MDVFVQYGTFLEFWSLPSISKSINSVIIRSPSWPTTVQKQSWLGVYVEIPYLTFLKTRGSKSVLKTKISWPHRCSQLILKPVYFEFGSGPEINRIKRSSVLYQRFKIRNSNYAYINLYPGFYLRNFFLKSTKRLNKWKFQNLPLTFTADYTFCHPEGCFLCKQIFVDSLNSANIYQLAI